MNAPWIRLTGTTAAVLALGGLTAPGAGGSVPATGAAPAAPVLAQDSFTRSVASGWGKAEVGGSYAAAVTSGVSVNGTAGLLTVPKGQDRRLRLTGVSSADIDALITLRAAALPTGGTGLYVGPTLNTTADGASYFQPQLKIAPNGTAVLRILLLRGATTTALTGNVAVPFTVTPTTKVMLRVRSKGTATRTLSAKVWRQGTAEPAAWSTTATSAALAGAGSLGLVGYASAGGTAATIAVDDLVVTSLANNPPAASFSAGVDTLAVAVSAAASTDTDGSIAGYRWDFGDGTTGTGVTASHTYATGGTRTITLTVTDDRGATATTAKTVTVIPPVGTVKPGAGNTGVPAGTTLRHLYPAGGTLTITTPGAVYDSVHIHGLVNVKADHVTIRNSVISGSDTNTPLTANTALVKATAGNTGLVIEDTTIKPTHSNVRLNVMNGWNFTLRRIEAAGGVDGIMIYGPNVRIESSWIHGLVAYPNDPNQGGTASHSDGIQVQGGANIRIIGNTIADANNAALMITQDYSATSDTWFNRNWVNQGWCSVNIAKKNRPYLNGLQLNGNRFGRNQGYANCAIIMNAAHSNLGTTAGAPTGNVWEDTGAPATIKRGA